MTRTKFPSSKRLENLHVQNQLVPELYSGAGIKFMTFRPISWGKIVPLTDRIIEKLYYIKMLSNVSGFFLLQ